jgi:hypothetical protein
MFFRFNHRSLFVVQEQIKLNEFMSGMKSWCMMFNEIKKCNTKRSTCLCIKLPIFKSCLQVRVSCSKYQSDVTLYHITAPLLLYMMPQIRNLLFPSLCDVHESRCIQVSRNFNKIWQTILLDLPIVFRGVASYHCFSGPNKLIRSDLHFRL